MHLICCNDCICASIYFIHFSLRCIHASCVALRAYSSLVAWASIARLSLISYSRLALSRFNSFYTLRNLSLVRSCRCLSCVMCYVNTCTLCATSLLIKFYPCRFCVCCVNYTYKEACRSRIRLSSADCSCWLRRNTSFYYRVADISWYRCLRAVCSDGGKFTGEFYLLLLLLLFRLLVVQLLI